MTVATKELTVEEKAEALFVSRAEATEVDDCDCFAPVRKWEKPVCITPAELGEMLVEIVKPGSTVAFFSPAANDLDAMSADLDDLRDGKVEPMVHLTAEQMAEIESERPGAEFCAKPFNY